MAENRRPDKVKNRRGLELLFRFGFLDHLDDIAHAFGCWNAGIVEARFSETVPGSYLQFYLA
jgi:hypothetical protein